VWITTLSMMVGKAVRYIAVIYAAEGIASLF
jgi:membrane protein YqaA with SNARE-associated domain